MSDNRLVCIKCEFILHDHYKKCPFCNKSRLMVAKANFQLYAGKFAKNPSAYHYSLMEKHALIYQDMKYNQEK